jgi:hypothetical protein
MPALSVPKLYGLPIYAIGAGYIAGMAGAVIGAVKDRRIEKQPDKEL